MDPVRTALGEALADEPDVRAFLDDARDKLRSDPAKLPVLFPQLPRRVGRGLLGCRQDEALAGEVGRGALDLRAWRRCDAAAYALLHEASASATTLLDLFHHGDLEEQTMVLRALAALPDGARSDATAPLFGEAQRTNNAAHFATLALDSDLVLRAREAEAVTQDDVRRLVLKVAFLDFDLDRLLGWERLVDGELTRMVQDLATEREAATRKVWHGTNRLIARAPIEGTRARLLGGLEHGDDEHRLAAADGLRALPDAEAWARFAAERVAREPRAEIRSVLEPLAAIAAR
jgi:hypothetical protein